MRQALVPVVAWSLATGAAVTLSWWGVHSVMAGTAYDPPRAVPIAVDGRGLESPPPLIPATQRPESPHATPSSPAPADSGRHRTAPEGGGHATPAPPRAPSAGGTVASGPASAPPATHSAAPQGQSPTVRSYEITGGRAVFSVGRTSASLVSATPDAGWQMQTWTEPEWVRVTFTKGERESSVFYTWNGHEPMAQFDSR